MHFKHLVRPLFTCGMISIILFSSMACVVRITREDGSIGYKRPPCTDPNTGEEVDCLQVVDRNDIVLPDGTRIPVVLPPGGSIEYRRSKTTIEIEPASIPDALLGPRSSLMEPPQGSLQQIALNGLAALDVYLDNYQISSLQFIGGLTGLGNLNPILDWDAVLDSEQTLIDQASTIVVQVDIKIEANQKTLWVTAEDFGDPLMNTLLDIALASSGRLTQEDIDDAFELYGFIVTSMHAAHEGYIANLLSSGSH